MSRVFRAEITSCILRLPGRIRISEDFSQLGDYDIDISVRPNSKLEDSDVLSTFLVQIGLNLEDVKKENIFKENLLRRVL